MDPAGAATPNRSGMREDRDGQARGIRAMADECVKCGLCLEYCPTYRLTGLEGESPRGRIALVQGLTEKALPAGGRTAEHLESCTGCLNCETVCPARVRYGRLIDEGRTELRRQGRRGVAAARGLAFISRHPHIARSLITLLRLFRWTRLQSALDSLGFSQNTAIGRLLCRLPVSGQSERRPPSAGSGDGPRSPVMLFAGCVTPLLDPKTPSDALAVLRAAGAAPIVPTGPTCCGALDLHDGQPEAAARLARNNCRLFGGDAPILTLASGCAATLFQYGMLVPDSGDRFADRVQDVIGYLGCQWDALVGQLSPLDMRVAVFEPCSVRNAAPAHSITTSVLERLPGVEIIEIDPGFGCCGAAGHHFLTRPEQADALLDPILTQIDAASPDVVAVPNIGCALHIRGALMARGSDTEVLHPVSLIARSLAGSR